jgi:hypothetical protein
VGLGAGCVVLTMMENNGRCVREGHMLFRILQMILVVSGCFQPNSDGGIVLGRRRRTGGSRLIAVFVTALAESVLGTYQGGKARCRISHFRKL